MSFTQRDYGSSNLIIDTVIGYRQWYFCNNELFSHGDTVWIDRSLIGECKAWGSELFNTHDAPDDGCTCGIYAHYLPLESYARGFSNVFGVVRASGKILMGTKGFRAEKVEIAALAALGQCNRWFECTESALEPQLETLVDFCTKIGVPYFSTVEEMVEQFPQVDLTSLGVPSLENWKNDRDQDKQRETQKIEEMHRLYMKAYLTEQELIKASGADTLPVYAQGRYLETLKHLGGF